MTTDRDAAIRIANTIDPLKRKAVPDHLTVAVAANMLRELADLLLVSRTDGPQPGGSMWNASIEKGIELCRKHGHEGDAATLEEILAYRPQQPEDLLVLRVADTLERAGENREDALRLAAESVKSIEDVECQDCNGTGDMFGSFACEECGGSGRVVPEPELKPLPEAVLDAAFYEKDADGSNVTGGCNMYGFKRAVRWAERKHNIVEKQDEEE